MERWRAYEDEWADAPFIDDLAAHYLGFHKAKQPAEVPMTVEEYFKKYSGIGGRRES
jgi:hypothetical protein